jgi:hypothetical protein
MRKQDQASGEALDTLSNQTAKVVACLWWLASLKWWGVGRRLWRIGGEYGALEKERRPIGKERFGDDKRMPVEVKRRQQGRWRGAKRLKLVVSCYAGCALCYLEIILRSAPGQNTSGLAVSGAIPNNWRTGGVSRRFNCG